MDHDSAKLKTPTVFPNPARACEGDIRRGATRVNGRRAIHSPDVGGIDEGGVVDGVSGGLKANEESIELRNNATEGSYVHNSHRSKVAVVSP